MERRSLLVRSGVVLVSLPARSEGFSPGVEAAFGPKGSQKIQGLRMAFDVQEQLAVLLGGLPAGSGDVHQSQFAEFLNEILALRRKEHKVVFRHFRYHNIAPSPAACCLVFTIFWADLERFSSSSMKRLILRMASSYPGICTFSYKFTF